ncbi:hypothetical protein [Verrucomicrobium spinosum]|uniref:hypothetical protein n=1 Tax=Verrucomicrobium spinosum TaxID=2736 RepID=UPI000AD8FB74|nr:hypothetical protein [Verrucomicrobium spinosum]
MRYASTLFSTAVLGSLLLAGPKVRAETNYGQVAMHVAYMLQNHHYSRKEFDDEISKRLLDSYLNFLDFSHIYLTQEDVDKFKTDYATSLDEHILTRNISPALDIYYKYEERVKQRVAYAKKVLETKKFAFDSNRSLEVKREKAPWPANEAASDALWNDLIEGDLLAERLSDKPGKRPRRKRLRKEPRRLPRIPKKPPRPLRRLTRP